MLSSAYLFVAVRKLFFKEGEVRWPERLTEARKERGGALAEEGFGHFGLLGVREVRVAALLRRKVSGVQPGKSGHRLMFRKSGDFAVIFF